MKAIGWEQGLGRRDAARLGRKYWSKVEEERMDGTTRGQRGSFIEMQWGGEAEA